MLRRAPSLFSMQQIRRFNSSSHSLNRILLDDNKALCPRDRSLLDALVKGLDTGVLTSRHYLSAARLLERKVITKDHAEGIYERLIKARVIGDAKSILDISVNASGIYKRLQATIRPAKVR